MKFICALLSLIFLATDVKPSSAQTRIVEDMGGAIGDYLLKFAAIRDSRERVIIDGSCFSACTLVTALIPRDRICITERAVLGFHAGWFKNKAGQRLTSPIGTRVLYELYPPAVRRWISRQGGLGKRMILLGGEELARIYRYCR